MLGLSPFLLLELGLRLGGWQPHDAAELDPFLSLRDVRPLFERQGDQLAIPQSRLEYFLPESFPAQKPDRQFRVFCLGGSTVQGNPWGIETAFSTWLELSLRAAAPDREWDVVNCGGISYASYRLVPILEEVLRYEPDLIILYTGHNEFLEDRTYGHLRDLPRPIAQLHRWLDRTRSYRWARELVRPRERPLDGPETLGGEVDTMLDHRDGLERYHRDPGWWERIDRHYAFNIERMIDLAGAAGIPVVICDPVENLGNSPPFKFEPDMSLDEPTRAKVARLWESAHPERTPALADRIALLEQAVALDPKHAGVHYQLGKCLQAQEQWQAARQHLLAAKEEDVCPLRMRESTHRLLLEIVKRRAVAWVEVRRGLESLSPGGIPGREWLVDHVHPDIHGHQWIAERLLEKLVELGEVRVAPGYEQRRSDAFRRHLESLDQVYFSKADERLAGQRRWSSGRVGRPAKPE